MHYVYVLRSIRSDRLYIGVSTDIVRRLQEHNAGMTRSTKPFLPYVIVYSERYQNKHDALQRERQIKSSGKIRRELKEGTYRGLIV